MSALLADDAASVYSAAYSVGSVASTAGGAKKPRRKKPKAAKTSEPSKPECTPFMVQQGLSQLGKTADGLRTAYLRLDVTGTSMVSTDPVTMLPDLQTLVLPHNELQDLGSLQQLPHLTSVNVSHNRLTQVLAFKAPEGGSNLRVADLSHNLISMVPDLSRFKRLTRLNLDHNQLESMTGIGSLPMLTTLSLDGNRLVSLNGLEKLSGLRQLNVAGNQIRLLSALEHLTSLEVLELARNKVASLHALSHLVRLQQLDISDNHLTALSDLSPCTAATLLRELKVEGNALCQVMSCRLHLVHLLPQVSILNGKEVSAEEKVLSSNMHGADAEDLRRIRRRYFPDGELDDGGGALPPPSAGLVASCAEEEVEGGQQLLGDFLRVDAWARSVPVPQPPTTEDTTSSLPEAQDGIQEQEESDVRAGSPRQAGVALIALAEHLSSTCTTQLQRARVCLEWVASHLSPPPVAEGPLSVSAPLFTPSAASGGLRAPDYLLVRGQRGTWAERAATLFCLLAKACQLEAVVILGYSKSLGLLPGESLAAHNHCWAGVKVNGRWRLVDPALCAMRSGACDSAALPFYVPPQAWIYSYFPLEAHWQLLPDPITLDSWWTMPALSVGFFARGMKLLQPSTLAAVNTEPAPKEGGQYPCFELCIAAPVSPSSRFRHVLKGATTGRVVAQWQEPSQGPMRPQEQEQPCLMYQQVEQADDSTALVQFGAQTFACRPHRLVTSLPHAGDYLLEVYHVTDVPGGLPVQLQDLSAPLVLRLEESECVLSTRVVCPEVEPHDPEDGILHSADMAVCPQPNLHPQFLHLRAQLLSPRPGTLLEADRTYTFKLLVPAGAQVCVSAEGGFSVPLRPTAADGQTAVSGVDCCPCQVAAQCVMERPAGGQTDASDPVNNSSRPVSATQRPASATQRPASATQRPASAAQRPASATQRPGSAAERPSSSSSASSGNRLTLVEADVTVPRTHHVHVVTFTHMPDLQACGWLPMLTFPVVPEAQHIVDTYQEPDIPRVDRSDPAAAQVNELFNILDINKDGKVTRGELLCALRRHAGVSKELRIPTAVQAHDGTLDTFVDKFLTIDNSKLGAFDFSELCLHLGVKPTEVCPSEEAGSEGSWEEEDGGEDVPAEGDTYDGDSRPVSPP